MSDLEKLTELPTDFDGRVRLFPIPELVVFPHAMQPLHIFEPRYCQMLGEALAGDRLIAMATLAPGWQPTLDQNPAISPNVCICRIVSHTETEDDRHNILLVGVRRARVVEELDTGQSFRSARVEVLEDVYPIAGGSHRPALKDQLLTTFRNLIPALKDVQQNLQELMQTQMRLGAVTDIIGFTMQFAENHKLALLGECDVDARARMLIEVLESRSAADAAKSPQPDHTRPGPFPPPFSLN